MKPAVEQMSLFDFLSDEPEAAAVPVEIVLPVQERRSVLALERAPKEFDGIRIGSVCEIVSEDPRKETLPHLYTETEIGKRIVVTELSIDGKSKWAWGYRVQLRPILPVGEQRSKRLEYDPRCSVAPYQVGRLKLIM